MSTAADVFSRANPHALATILDAAETRSIIAARDIFDISGIKLWARDQPVSQALQRKLMDRRLKSPLESCLIAEDGVTAVTLLRDAQALAAGDAALARLLGPHTQRVVDQVPHLPLHPVAQLLLTAGQASRPDSYRHAMGAMLVAGALMAAGGGGLAELRSAMLGGLLHDLGELYIDPRHGEADAERTLDFGSYQALVVHPHVGRLLLEQLTNYPASIARAVGEHHERLDGSGYPHALRRDAVSPLGRLLAVTDAALSALRSGRTGLWRASVALRVVPGEFDLAWVGRIGDAAREAAREVVEAAEPAASPDVDAVQSRLERLDAGLELALHGVAAPQTRAGVGDALAGALDLAQHLLGRLRAGWNASGLWSGSAVTAADAAEIEAIEDELYRRLRGIERAVRLRAGRLPAADAARLDGFCAQLRAIAG